jgi:hypothetical protein
MPMPSKHKRRIMSPLCRRMCHTDTTLSLWPTSVLVRGIDVNQAIEFREDEGHRFLL